MSKIIIRANEEYQVRILSEPNTEESVYSSFEQAKFEVEDIVLGTEKYYNKKSKGHFNNSFSNQELLDKSLDFSNNIIAFSGDRGQGKSSAMLSFSSFLLNKDTGKNKNFLGSKICESNFIILDRIDPTKFEIGDNILTTILAKIFREFCNDWNVSEKSEVAMRSELLELFQSCYKEIDTIKNHSKDSKSLICNDLERLGRIGDSANLKEHLLELITKYFDFRCTVRGDRYKNENNFLVIQLDDTDLNTDKAYDIVEDVRKYFMIPNVIVLMAVDLSLLTYSIEQSYIQQFMIYENYHSSERLNEYHQLAVKYIDKLIPGRRKVFLPYIKPATDEYGEKTTIEYIDDNKENSNLLNFTDNQGNVITDVQELMLRFIYEKTGLIFIKPNNYRHNIVPGTMRELVNFLSILNNMENIKNDYSDIEDLKLRVENLSLFETYFTKTWVPNHVIPTYAGIINSLLDSPWTVKNKQIIKDISNNFKTSLSGESGGHTVLEEIIGNIESKASKNDIYSLADVRAVLHAIEDMMPQQDIYKFNFAVRTIYSIYISRLICNELIHELKGEQYDYNALCSFLGGDVFGDSANEFVRRQNNRYSRGIFTTDISNYDSDFANLNKLMNIEQNSYIAAAFCNFEFPKEQEYTPPYDVSYRRTSNNTRSSVWNFNVSYPFLYLIQPNKLFERISGNEIIGNIKIKHPEEILSVRYECIQIISSMDFINYIEKSLRKRYVTRSNNWEFCKFISECFERVEDYISKINYLPISNDWSNFISYIEKSSEILETLYSVYTDNYDYIPEYELLRSEVMQLSTFKNTKDYDALLRKINSLYYRLDDLSSRYEDGIIMYYFDEVSDIAEEVELEGEEMSLDEIYDYQRKLNHIVRDLKNNFS